VLVSNILIDILIKGPLRVLGNGSRPAGQSRPDEIEAALRIFNAERGWREVANCREHHSTIVGQLAFARVAD
jgi:hypothetical protein